MACIHRSADSCVLEHVLEHRDFLEQFSNIHDEGFSMKAVMKAVVLDVID